MEQWELRELNLSRNLKMSSVKNITMKGISTERVGGEVSILAATGARCRKILLLIIVGLCKSVTQFSQRQSYVAP